MLTLHDVIKYLSEGTGGLLVPSLRDSLYGVSHVVRTST